MELATTTPVVDGKFELVPDSEFKVVERSRTRASKTNPRKIFDEAFLKDLAGSIKEYGIVQPILMRPVTPTKAEPQDLEVVAGEQRWRASLIAGLTKIPVLIRVLTDQQVYEIQVLENLQRRDLHPLEEAEGFEQLIKTYGYKRLDLAEKINRSKAYVDASMKLLDLCDGARKLFYAKHLTLSLAVLIARIPGSKLQMEACGEIAGDKNKDPMSQRVAINLIQRKFMLKLKEAPFNIKDEALLPKVGACTTCPKRTGNQPDQFPDVESADVCTDTACFSQKRSAWSTIQVNKAKERGRTVIDDTAAAKKIFPYGTSDSTDETFKKPSETCYRDPKNRTYGQLAKASGIDPVAVRHPVTQDVIELISMDDLKPAVKELGISLSGGSLSDSEKAAIKKAKFNTEFRVDVLSKIRENMQATGPQFEDWQMVAAHVLHRTESNTLRRLLKFLGWDVSMASYDGRKELADKLRSLNTGELADVIWTASIFSCTQANSNYNNNDEAPEELANAAKRHGVDAAKIKAQHKAEATAEANSKLRAARIKAESKAKEKQAAIAVPKTNKADETVTAAKPAPAATKPAAKKSPAKPKKAAPKAKAAAAAPTPPTAAPAADAQDWSLVDVEKQPAYTEGYNCTDLSTTNPYPPTEPTHDHWNIGRLHRSEFERKAGPVEFALRQPVAPAKSAWPFKTPDQLAEEKNTATAKDPK
ncbi:MULTISPECIES: ParB/RepB/Spo0J family partition protein [unclassified Herbaspirillum]|uniref:ParB/RepB/Spo0J family partition protein n=1 Tax=unclassified Herbaspirillum TaxID=2624150 RepID=UPI000E2E72FD|nr:MULTISPECIES: ParB/RepB/Spo0J family partition protein [unclassified Herbaspirillum]RFB73843.1 ParB/RepB/Spo0J family partition protein [Herbaspirillum sp. 3R-3a1]TFI10346.1 ParB/RepB/Spo0J family partition protein [Herbaspirillum sp. 3R11]TFI16250.1 ParB/RepB/Spo0J family partition protein [Herbaspirillum sp. 3R-11]TFI28347.1 ParB/RepB/Spo0J family partition protein [Herbaspirillum sp. 3C11]